MGLATLGKVILGTAGANYAARKANKYSSQAFDQRMQDAEKYGIHPLQALGGNANFQGTGGFNIGNQINSERALQKERDYQDSIREDQQAHEQTMQMIKDQAEDQRLTRRLEAEAKSPLLGDNIMDLKDKAAKYWGPAWAPIIETVTDAGEGISERFDKISRDLYDATIRKNLKFKD